LSPEAIVEINIVGGEEYGGTEFQYNDKSFFLQRFYSSNILMKVIIVGSTSGVFEVCLKPYGMLTW